jgi:hypothetical protein
MLEAGEQIVCAAFVRLASGPNLGCRKDGWTPSQRAAVTDRRLIKAVAWWSGRGLLRGAARHGGLAAGQSP